MDKSVRIPRENMHDQDERLTNKHIQTLGFLQEIANENKMLKERVQELEESLEECKDLHVFAKESKEKIKDIQNGYMARADEINTMLSEKHRVEIMQVQEEKLEMERDLKEQMLKMRHEIETLRAANTDLRETAAEEEESNETKNKLKEVMKQMHSYRKENEELKEEIESVRSDLEILQSKKASDMTLIRELRTENKNLEQTLQEIQQKNNELELRLDKCVAELKEKENDQEQADLVENLRDKVKQLSYDREAYIEREAQLVHNLTDMAALKDDMKKANFHLECEMEKILTEYGCLAKEHEKLKKRCAKDKDKKTFQDFVSLKRELNCVRNENEALKSNHRTKELQMLKEEIPIQPQPKSIKKNSLQGTRTGAKKMLAISLGNSKELEN